MAYTYSFSSVTYWVKVVTNIDLGFSHLNRQGLMTKILILGGYGATGKVLAWYLLKWTAVEVVLAGRHPEKAKELVDQLKAEFNNRRVCAVKVDAAQPEILEDALKGIDLLVVASPTTSYAELVIDAALKARVDYLDIQLSAEKLAYLQSRSEAISQSGCCFITEAGFHPGMSAAMVRHAASRIDNLVSADVFSYLNIGRSASYTEAVNELMETFKHYDSRVYRDGSWTKPNSYRMQKTDFGGDIGVRNCYPMYFEELGALPLAIPSLKQTGFYMSELHPLLDWIVTPLVFVGIKLFPVKGMVPLGKLMWTAMCNLPRPPYKVVLMLVATGMRDGKQANYQLTISHADGYHLTAIPVAACIKQLLEGNARKPGLWMMGYLVDTDWLLRDMAEMGAGVE